MNIVLNNSNSTSFASNGAATVPPNASKARSMSKDKIVDGQHENKSKSTLAEMLGSHSKNRTGLAPLSRSRDFHDQSATVRSVGNLNTARRLVLQHPYTDPPDISPDDLQGFGRLNFHRLADATQGSIAPKGTLRGRRKAGAKGRPQNAVKAVAAGPSQVFTSLGKFCTFWWWPFWSNWDFFSFEIKELETLFAS